jgi:hypothetical protein
MIVQIIAARIPHRWFAVRMRRFYHNPWPFWNIDRKMANFSRGSPKPAKWPIIFFVKTAG